MSFMSSRFLLACNVLVEWQLTQFPDYLHLTKRFGVIAASQFPVHYMLIMKSRASPIGFLFRTSHEQLNPWHRLQGRTIYTLLICHATFYLNFFVRANLLSIRLRAPVVIVGMTAFTLLTTLMTSSLSVVRRYSYRVFFILHLLIGITLMPLLFFHAAPLRLYVGEALLLVLLDITIRRLDTTSSFTAITPIPNTNLLKLSIPIPASKLARFRKAPGQHVYLSIPPSSRPKNSPNQLVHEFLFNPFTIASTSPDGKGISLILRSLSGPTTLALNTLSKLPKARPPIAIEGPLGFSSKLQNIASRYDRFLFVAGGVGATYILPFYHSVREGLEKDERSTDRATLVWSMRSPAEAGWADPETLVEDENVEIYVTGLDTDLEEESVIPKDGSVELKDLRNEQQILSRSDASQADSQKGSEEVLLKYAKQSRPDLKKLVDETFRLGSEERVAVLVCGPKGMARELRGHVGVWVEKGREVLWHEEGFGW